jgi:hypothetical protein
MVQERKAAATNEVGELTVRKEKEVQRVKTLKSQPTGLAAGGSGHFC